MPLLAQETASSPGFQLQFAPLFNDHGIPLAIMGVLVVFVALLLVSLFITALPRLMAALERRVPEQKPAAQAQPAVSTDEVPAETVAVIAAAVAATLGRPHRIIHTRELTAEDLAWSLEGRMQHHASHRAQRRDRW